VKHLRPPPGLERNWSCLRPIHRDSDDSQPHRSVTDSCPGVYGRSSLRSDRDPDRVLRGEEWPGQLGLDHHSTEHKSAVRQRVSYRLGLRALPAWAQPSVVLKPWFSKAAKQRYYKQAIVSLRLGPSKLAWSASLAEWRALHAERSATDRSYPTGLACWHGGGYG